MKFITITVIALMLVSCAGELKRDAAISGEYFSGEFVYFADAANFVSCATGARFAVSNAGAYIDAERGYMALNVEPQQYVFIEFIGHITQQPKLEGEGQESVVVIDSLIGFGQADGCNPEYILTGVYEAVSRDSKRILRIKPDFSYTESKFSSSESAQESDGRWFLSAEMEFVLIQREPHTQDSISTFEVVTPQHALAKNSGGEPLVFTKVYL